MLIKPFVIRFLIGLLMPFLGLFVGLQLSPALGNILMFPIIAVSAAVGVPLGEMSGLLWASMVLLSGVVWMVVLSLPSFITRAR